MRARAMQAGDRRGRSWRSSRELAYGGGLEAGTFPGAAQNQVARRVFRAEPKPLDLEVSGPPAEAADFRGGAPRVSDEKICLQRSHSAYLAVAICPRVRYTQPRQRTAACALLGRMVDRRINSNVQGKRLTAYKATLARAPRTRPLKTQRAVPSESSLRAALGSGGRWLGPAAGFKPCEMVALANAGSTF